MKVLERHIPKIRPDKWDEVEGIDNKYDAVEGKYGYPPKRYYRCFSGPHDIFTSIFARIVLLAPYLSILAANC